MKSGRCIVCHRHGCPHYKIIASSEVGTDVWNEISFCDRHHNELIHIDWDLFCQKYDAVYMHLRSLGFDVAPGGKVYRSDQWLAILKDAIKSRH